MQACYEETQLCGMTQKRLKKTGMVMSIPYCWFTMILPCTADDNEEIDTRFPGLKTWNKWLAMAMSRLNKSLETGSHGRLCSHLPIYHGILTTQRWAYRIEKEVYQLCDNAEVSVVNRIFVISNKPQSLLCSTSDILLSDYSVAHHYWKKRRWPNCLNVCLMHHRLDSW